MTRSLNRLTSLKVARAKRPGMYADGGSLYLRIASGGSKQWIFRFTCPNGRLRDMSLGAVHTFSLAEARERATEARKLRADGIDPLDHKRAQRAALRAADAKAMTFEQCARGFIKDNEAEWTNPKHRHEWETTLRKYVFPLLGSLPVEAIDTPLVLKVVKPLWERIPTTASRVLGRIQAVLGWATVHHYRSGDNPARWQGHLEHALPALSKVAKAEHHAALPYAQVGAFVAKLRKDSSVGARHCPEPRLRCSRQCRRSGNRTTSSPERARDGRLARTRLCAWPSKPPAATSLCTGLEARSVTGHQSVRRSRVKSPRWRLHTRYRMPSRPHTDAATYSTNGAS